MIENIRELEKMEPMERIQAMNEIKDYLKSISPFKGEPVDCVK